MIADSDRCPCGSGSAFGECCGPLHRGETPQTAERLMRSRYSAFAVGDVAYLRATWHPSTRPRDLELDPTVRWRRLEIVSTVGGSEAEASGEVEFRAFWRTLPAPGAPRDGGVLHERSRFVREHGRWYYVDGEIG